VLEAAVMLGAAPDRDRYRFILLGDGAEKAKLRDRARASGVSSVLFLDSVPKEEVVRYWSLLDVSLIHLKREPLFRLVIPSKLFESMGMGIPILHGVEGESAEIVEREQVGLLFEPENPDALVAALRKLAEDDMLRRTFATNGPQAARRYDRRAQATEMLRVLESVSKGQDPSCHLARVTT
jgi:glycosyltransferase involved in cell wall biosynthesis